MGFDCGFDMYLRLTKSPSDAERWASFINDICCRYLDGNDSDDDNPPRNPNVAMKTCSKGSYIEFLVGEHPKLPYDGTQFLRFSSKVSGPRTQAAEPYIREVRTIAKKRFGDRIKWWHELSETEDPRTSSGFYDWTEVSESENIYYD